jgi:hypothetical protein
MVGILGLGSVLWHGVFSVTPYMVLIVRGSLWRGSPKIATSFPGMRDSDGMLCKYLRDQHFPLVKFNDGLPFAQEQFFSQC